MVDEIAREMRMGWEITVEWIILYILFFIQLIYSVITGYTVKTER